MPLGDLARSDEYQLPDVGAPLIPPGPQLSPGVPWANRAADAMGSLLGARPDQSDPTVMYRTASPLVNITQGDLDRTTDLALSFSGGGLATKAVRARPALAEPVPAVDPAHIPGTSPEQSAIARPNPIEQFVTDPQRIYKPGIYKDPRVIAAEANAMVAPEHPALKALFGVTRDDLYGISQQGTREGNVAPNIWQPAKPKGSYAAENIMNPANAQRVLDTLTEARKYPGLERGMVPWYVMDPAYQRLEQLVGPERAVAEYNKFNNYMTPFSASSDVMKEINRGTGARMMAEQGRLPDFVKYGGMPVEKRGADFPPEMADIIPHLRHAPTHTDPVTKYLATGAHGYGQDTVKIPLYTQASGVPQTGFQTAWPGARRALHPRRRDVGRAQECRPRRLHGRLRVPDLRAVVQTERGKAARHRGGADAGADLGCVCTTDRRQDADRRRQARAVVAADLGARAEARRRPALAARPSAARQAARRIGRRQPWHGEPCRPGQLRLRGDQHAE